MKNMYIFVRISNTCVFLGEISNVSNVLIIFIEEVLYVGLKW